MTEEENIQESSELEEKQEAEQIVEEKQDVQEEKKETITLKEDPNFEIIDGIKYPKDVMDKARIQGWRDKDFLEKVGKSEKYMNPEEFVERGNKAVPFLNKRIKQKDEEISTLKKLLQRHIKTQMNGQLDNIEDRLKEAKELGESDKIENLVKQKFNVKNEIDQLEKEETETNVSPNYYQENDMTKMRHMIEEVKLNWELRNPWVFDANSPKTKFANAVYKKVVSSGKNLDINQILSIVDENVKDYDSKQYLSAQKRNLSIPNNQNSSIAKTGLVSRSIKNLKPELQKQYETDCVDMHGNKLKGNDLKIYKESFLSVCKDSDFIA